VPNTPLDRVVVAGCRLLAQRTWRANASRNSRRWSASASSYASAPSSFSKRVDPSMSVKSKVTLPDGSS
jgi:hypothetical protein